MNKEEFKAEAAKIDEAYKAVETYPHDPAALSAYARSYQVLLKRQHADEVAEYNERMAAYNAASK